MTSTSSALLGLCVCGEPIFRHRLGRRQISCAAVRRIDQQFFESVSQPVHQPDRQFQVVTGGRDRDRAIAEASIHGGER